MRIELHADTDEDAAYLGQLSYHLGGTLNVQRDDVLRAELTPMSFHLAVLEVQLRRHPALGTTSHVLRAEPVGGS